MAKSIKHTAMEPELRQRLDAQDQEIETFKREIQGDMRILNKTMNEILDLLKGSSIMNTPGIIKSFRDFEGKLDETISKMEHWERWRQNQIAKKGTFTFRTATLFTQSLAVIGGVATLSAIVYTILQIIDLVKKLQ
jgi:hypothetical protein